MDEYFFGAVVSASKGRTDRASANGRPTCGLYEDCNAPLCPLDQDSLKGIWYPDEEICRSRTHGNLPWIRSQRKIARAEASGYFNLEILTSIRTIRKGITGLDPNAEEKLQLRRWLGLHEKKRATGNKVRNEAARFEAGKVVSEGPPVGPFPRRRTDRKKGVSAHLKNVAK